MNQPASVLKRAIEWASALLLLGGIVVGALWIATAEVQPRPWPRGETALPSPSTPSEPWTPSPVMPSPSPSPSPLPSPTPTPSPTASPTGAPTEPPRTPTPSPSRTPCRPPADWVPYRVQPGDTAFRLATLAGIPLPRFLEANCLRHPALFIGQRVYLPVNLPTPTPNPTPCGPPPDWVLYTVQPGETLYRLAVRFQVPLALLMHANCLTTPALSAGQRLYVPPGTPTPAPSPIPGESPTVTPEATP